MANTLKAGTYWICKGTTGTEELYFLSSTRYAETDKYEVFVQLSHLETGGRWSNPVEVRDSDDITKQEFEALCQGQEFEQVEVDIKIKRKL